MTEQDSYWKRLYESLIVQNQKLEQKITEQAGVIGFLSENNTNAQAAVDIMKQTLLNATMEHNKKEQQLIGYMNKLKEKLKEYGFADFNTLADSVEF